MSFPRQTLVSCGLLALLASFCVLTSAQHATFLPDQNTEAAAHAERGFEFARAGELGKPEAEPRLAAKFSPANQDVLAGLRPVLAPQGKLCESSGGFTRRLP